jgi:hypothetical protein
LRMGPIAPPSCCLASYIWIEQTFTRGSRRNRWEELQRLHVSSFLLSDKTEYVSFFFDRAKELSAYPVRPEIP